MNDNEFLASQTFSGMEKETGETLDWKYEKSENHGNTVFHWFSTKSKSSTLIGVAVADMNQRWLGSAWSNYDNATEKKCVVRDLPAARQLRDALEDVERNFLEKYQGIWSFFRVFFTFLTNNKEKNLALIRTVCLCELRYAAKAYEAEG